MSPGLVAGLCCTACGAWVEGDARESVCDCGAEGIFEVRYDLDAVREAFEREPPATRPPGYLRYAELLPLRGAAPALTPSLTPLRAAPALARLSGTAAVHVKDETVQPSASVKDRAGALACARAAALGASEVACASTGNAAGALAAAAAAQGLRAHVFVPASAPAAKLRQSLAYGADVHRVDGTYERSYDICVRAAAEAGWYDASCARNPYLLEGQKTCAFELVEQSGDRPPDWVVVPTGDGCTLAGTWKGLRELAELGRLAALPRMLAVRAGRDSFAESIAVTRPRNGARAEAAVAESGGANVTVDDDGIRSAVETLAAATGVYAEPAAAASLAGLLAAREAGLVAPGDRVVLLVTGSGLKAAG